MGYTPYNFRWSDTIRVYARRVTIHHRQHAAKSRSRSPIGGSSFTYSVDEWVNTNAEINDNYAVARVEFFKGNEESLSDPQSRRSM